MKGIKYALLLAVVVRFSIGCLAGSVTGNGDVALCLTEPGRHDFVFDGREAIVVTPDSVATGSPWIWRPAFSEHSIRSIGHCLKKAFMWYIMILRMVMGHLRRLVPVTGSTILP